MSHDPRDIRLIVVHHTASPRSTTWRDIQRWHWKRFKMHSGYHRIIESDGFVMDGQRIQKRGAHAPPNSGRFGIVVVGDNTVPGRGWNATQWDSLIRELHYWCDRLPNADICGHNQTKPTECPGLDIGKALLERGWDRPHRLMRGMFT